MCEVKADKELKARLSGKKSSTATTTQKKTVTKTVNDYGQYRNKKTGQLERPAEVTFRNGDKKSLKNLSKKEVQEVLRDSKGIRSIRYEHYAMTGLFASTIHAPFTAVIIVAEMACVPSRFPELCIVAITSYAVARRLNGQPIYEQLLDRLIKGAGKDSPSA